MQNSSTNKLIEYSGAIEPKLTPFLVNKILERVPTLFKTHAELYDVLKQSTEKNVDVQAFYKWAEAIDRDTLIALCKKYGNTDVSDLREIFIKLKTIQAERNATTTYVKVIHTQNDRRIEGFRGDLKARLQKFLDEKYIQQIEYNVKRAGIRNLYSLYLSIKPQGLYLHLQILEDKDSDIVEKVGNPDNDSSGKILYFHIDLPTTELQVELIRKWGGRGRDIEDILLFE